MQRINSPVEVLCNWTGVANDPTQGMRFIKISRKIYVFTTSKVCFAQARGEGAPNAQPECHSHSVRLTPNNGTNVGRHIQPSIRRSVLSTCHKGARATKQKSSGYG